MKSFGCSVWILMLIILFDQGDMTSAACDEVGGWVPYRDQKCIKIMGDFVTFDTAIRVCEAITPVDPDFPANLLTIKTAREQAFLVDYIFHEFGEQNSIWLGITRLNYTEPFLWLDDDTTLNETYSNWAPANPVQEPDRDCIEMRSNYTRTHDMDEDVEMEGDIGPFSEGQWFNTACTRRALVVCESMPSVSLYELKRSLNEAIRRLEKLEPPALMNYEENWYV